MKRIPILLAVIAVFAVCQIQAWAADATNATQPTLEQRVADLEAYVNNSTRATDAATNGVKSNIPGPGPGHNAWQMTSAALVLFMTLPGLALFYGGLVRRKNVLSVVAQCFYLAGIVTVLWFVCGYSLAFHRGNPLLGGWEFSFFKGVDSNPNPDYSPWVSHNVYAMYQLMFAIITPALIIGSVAERMKFSAICLFMILWMFVVYFPMAHMIWGADGWMNGAGNSAAGIHAIDFAGGTVVHMTSGWSALVLCLILGKRVGWGKENFTPHSLVLCMVGTGMLWVGWYGFNAGSAVAADVIAANAFTTTTLATAVAALVWPMIEWMIRGNPSVLGFCSGAVAGLVVITPACGFVTPGGAVIIGIAAGVVPWFFCYKVKRWFGYDDALDTFGVHAVGGTMGALLTGMLARNSVNTNLATNLKSYVTDGWAQPLVFEQLKAMGVTLAIAVVGTTVIAFAVKGLVGLRPTREEELTGLDLIYHDEEGYHG